jgi:hypothetical protein
MWPGILFLLFKKLDCCRKALAYYFQCFGSGFIQVSGFGPRSSMAKITHKNRKCKEISYFEVLDVLF